MSARGWETVAELPSGKAKNVGYREAGAPDPIIANERWSNPVTRLLLWLGSGPKRPWEHTALACVLTERHLYVARTTGNTARVPLELMIEHRALADGAIAVAVEDGADVILPPGQRALRNGLAACREKHAIAHHPFTGTRRPRLKAKHIIALLVFALLASAYHYYKHTKRVNRAEHAEECKSKPACKKEGKCGSHPKRSTSQRCVPTRAEHCAQSIACADKGACDLRQHTCEPSKQDHCDESARCASEGRCSLGAMPKSKWVARKCVQTQAECRLRSECTEHGLCSPSAWGKKCRAESDADCATSKACTENQRCLARDGVCVKSCKESAGCKRSGRCTSVKNGNTKEMACAATSEEHCRTSTRCKSHGACSLNTNATCTAKKEEDCRASTECATSGHCFVGKYGCTAKSEKDCENTKRCREWGWCTVEKGNCRARSKANCEQSLSCKKWGRCTPVKGMCKTTTDEDCKNSDLCKKWKSCFHVSGSCKKIEALKKQHAEEGVLEKRSGRVR